MGQLVRRTTDLRAALNIGVQIGLDEIRADEFYALLFIDEEPTLLEQERAPAGGTRRGG